MDAIGAHATPEPNDDDLFSSIVADIDGHAIEEAATASAPEPTTPAEAASPAPLTTAPAADPADSATPADPARAPGSSTESTAAPSSPGVLEPAGLLAPPKPPELVVPPKPERPETGVVNWWAKAFPHIVWLSVIAGLAGQIFGFAEFFGGTTIAWIIASVAGTFEFMMVACSSRGLRAIGLGRDWQEYTPFLVLGTGAALFAAYMNLHHFSGWLGMAAGMVSLLGYCAHVFSHLYEELDHRTKLRAWEKDKARIEAEAEARAKLELAEYDAYRAEMAQHRRDITRNLVAAQAAPEPAKLTETTPAPRTVTKKPASKSSGRASKSDALRVGIEQKASTPARLREALTDAGYGLPSSSTTIETWCKEIKAALNDAT